jgi:hypothetical protein
LLGDVALKVVSVEFSLRWPHMCKKHPKIDDYLATTLGLAAEAERVGN